ncbi:helix-turn-helix domain-containing protein [Kordiimonas aquimaris]|uniref:helix-turn-helix domain-containing protein n=1 Tax=Kordiimonas aquimaris TaxID=707591 RepID=UPI0021D196A8|nr:helix-turn-helix transcriptional regulator [Kordiimonas aquimaris]
MSFDGGQLGAARVLHQPRLDIKTLASLVGMSTTTISQFERGEQNMSRLNRDKIKNFFNNRGISFTETGVERDKLYSILKGRDGFVQMYEHIYAAAQEEGAQLCIHNGVSHLVMDTLGADYVAMHKERMNAIKDNFTFRVIVEQGDDAYMGNDYCEYRWFPKDLAIDKTKFIYGSKLAYVDFDDGIEIIVINNKKIAQSARTDFNVVWEQLAKEPHEWRQSNDTIGQ